eukprot:tig00000718_g3688.t1
MESARQRLADHTRPVDVGPFESCSKQSPCIYAHRGGSFDAPENSFSAVKLAAEMGACGVEIDIRLSADNVCVCAHDDDLERVSDGRGKISESAWSYLRTVDISANHRLHQKFKGEKMPLAKDLIAFALKLGLKVMVDIKLDTIGDQLFGGDRPRRLIEEFVKIMRELNCYDRVCAVTFYPAAISILQELDPRVVHSLLWAGGNTHAGRQIPNPCLRGLFLAGRGVWSIFERALWFLEVKGLSVRHELIDEEFVSEWRRQGFAIFSWTCNGLEEKRKVLACGVPIITDSVRFLEGVPLS